MGGLVGSKDVRVVREDLSEVTHDLNQEKQQK